MQKITPDQSLIVQSLRDQLSEAHLQIASNWAVMQQLHHELNELRAEVVKARAAATEGPTQLSMEMMPAD